VTPEELVATLAELVRSAERLEAGQRELAAEARAAADRAAASVAEVGRAVEHALDRRLRQLGELDRHVAALDEARHALRQETERRRLSWPVEVPSLGWLTGAAVAGMALLLAAEIVLAPLLPSPAPAAAVEHPSPPAQRPERQHGRATSPSR
jgi:hypothetical protein